MTKTSNISRAALENVYQSIDDDYQKNYNRSLPLQDGLVNRWERAKQLGFGKNSSVYGSASILGNPSVGHDVWVGPNVYIEAINASIEIGNWSILSANVQIYTHNTVARALTFGKSENRTGAVKIGRGCYIGPNALIEAGSVIGDQCIVGAMSLVRGTFSDRSFIAGIPAKCIGNIKVNDDGTYLVVGI